MEELLLLGIFLPALPEFASIEAELREKYCLPEISPDDM